MDPTRYDENGYAVYELESYHPDRASGFFGKKIGRWSIPSLYWPDRNTGSMYSYSRAGTNQNNDYCAWTSVFFKQDDLSFLRARTARSVLLTMTAYDGNIRVGIDWKLNDDTGDFQRCDVNGEATSYNYLGQWVYDSLTNRNYKGSSGNERTFDLTRDITGGSGQYMGVPRYGYVLGSLTTAQGTFMVTFNDGDQSTVTAKRAKLVVTTTEKSTTLSFNANGGSGAPASITKLQPEGAGSWTIPATIPTKSGYTFSGWSTTSSGAASIQPSTTVNMPGGTLYAIWTEDATDYTYVYGALSHTEHIEIGSTYTFWNGGTWTKVKHHLTGWATSDGGAKAYDLGETITAGSDMTLYPYWSPDEYTVSYDANGGTGAPASQTKYALQTLTLSNSIPTKPGCTFAGWKGGSIVYQAGGAYTADAPITLIAQWTDIPGVRLYLCSHGATDRGVVLVKTDDGMALGHIYVMTASGLKEAR